jgi:hypothetical protein
MKRSLVAATAVALLLTGCATGDTGHLVPDIEPDLVGPRSTPQAVDGGSGGESSGTEGTEGTEGGEGGGSGDEGAEGTDGAASGSDGSGEGPGDATDVQAAFEEAAGGEPWFEDVTELVVDAGSIQVTTSLTAAGADAVAVCEAAVDAAETTGAVATSVEVLDAEGAVLSELDAAAGDEGCSG